LRHPYKDKGYPTARQATRLAPYLMLLALMVPAPARADGPTPAARTRAAELFKNGAEAYRKGNFQGTVNLLKEAYALDPQPVILYNLGRAYEGLGDGDAAMDAYRRYLEADPKAPDRPSIEQRLATLQRSKDEKAALEKQRDEERRKAEESARVAAEEQRRADEEHRRAQEKQRHKRSLVPYVVAGVGVAGLGAGAVFGLVANGKHDSAASEPVQSKAVDQQDQAKTFATISTVSFVAGGVLLAAGVTWWVLDAPPKEKQASQGTTRIGVAPAYVTLERSF
jgi:tetratricopeptide (TPR) repeat protein